MKKKIAFIIAAVLAFSAITISTAVASDDIKLVVAGQTISTDQPPVIQNSRTLVPLRAVSEAVGADVSWDAETKTAKVETAAADLQIQIGAKTLSLNNKLESGAAVSVDVDSPAQIINSRTMVPIRVIAETLGLKVDWDESSRTVIILPSEVVESTTEATTEETTEDETFTEESTVDETSDEESTEEESIEESSEEESVDEESTEETTDEVETETTTEAE